jgi:hypothetical protein
MLIDGHLRAETTPDSEVPVLVLDVTEAEADKILLTLDPLAGLATADSEAVKALLAGVSTESDAVRGLLDRVAKDASATSKRELQDPPAQIDKAAELQAKWGTETGQIWQIGPCRLLCGDCREKPEVGRLWRDGERFRMIWTDPPYGVSYGAKNEDLWLPRSSTSGSLLPSTG